MSPSRVPDGETRGHIVPIGGAENKENDPRILERFVRVSGGEMADIVVIPTASRANETGARYEKLFRELGARRVEVMDFDTRRDSQEAGRLAKQKHSHCHPHKPSVSNDRARLRERERESKVEQV